MAKQKIISSCTLKFVQDATQSLVNFEREREVISLGLVSGVGFMLFGRGGYGKSESTDLVKNAIRNCVWNITSLSSGTKVDFMKGGTNILALEKENRITYHYENSPLNANVVGLEEAFDAPDQVGGSLKDILSSKQFRDGKDVFDLPISLVYICTNKTPNEIEAKGNWMEALLQRFPMQVNSEWETHDTADYIQLLKDVDTPSGTSTIDWSEIVKMQNAVDGVEIPEVLKLQLAESYAQLSNKIDRPINPRIVKVCLKLIKASAVINNRKRVQPTDLFAIRHVTGIKEHFNDFVQSMNYAYEELVQENLYTYIVTERLKLSKSKGSVTAQNKTKELIELMKEVLFATDELRDKFEKLRKELLDFIS